MITISTTTEYLLSIDSFNEPETKTNQAAIACILTRLLLLEPGTFETHPNMGVGLISKYRFSQDGTASDLQSAFQSQIETYLPQFTGVKVTVTEKNKMFYIGAEIYGTVYGITINSTTLDTSVTYKALSDL